MIDPADLDDPAKAEAFLRETIAGLDADISEIQTETAREIQTLSERYRDDPEAFEKFSRRASRRGEVRLNDLLQHRERLIGTVAKADALRKIVDSRCRVVAASE